jgi:hypothetical protein
MSTNVDWLMGADFDESENTYGKRVFRYYNSENSADQRFPVIVNE